MNEESFIPFEVIKRLENHDEGLLNRLSDCEVSFDLAHAVLVGIHYSQDDLFIERVPSSLEFFSSLLVSF